MTTKAPPPPGTRGNLKRPEQATQVSLHFVRDRDCNISLRQLGTLEWFAQVEFTYQQTRTTHDTKRPHNGKTIKATSVDLRATPTTLTRQLLQLPTSGGDNFFIKRKEGPGYFF